MMTKLPRLCAALTRHWPLTLFACLALCGLCFVLPGSTALAAAGLLAALAGLWARYLLFPKGDASAFHCSAQELHRLASVKSIAVDAAVVRAPRQVSEVCLPLYPTVEKQLRLRPGALFLAAAATVTADLAQDEDCAALRSAVAAMGFNEKFLARCPVLETVSMQGLGGYIVKDGHGRRAYVTGSPAAMAACCPLLFDHAARPMTQEDRALISAQTGFGFAMAAVTEEGMEPLTYLGCLCVSEESRHAALESCRRLEEAGFDVTVFEEAAPCGALVVSFTPQPGAGMQFVPQEDDFASPILAAQAHERHLARSLGSAMFHLMQMLALAVFWPLRWWMLPLAALPALCTQARPPSFALPPLVWTALGSLLCRLFLTWVNAPLVGCGMLMAWAFAIFISLPRAGKNLWGLLLASGGAAGCAALWLAFQPGTAGAFALLSAGLIALVGSLMAKER